jgi:hypothetical protein
MVCHGRLRKRSFPVQIPHLLVRFPDHVHTRATPEVPLHGVDLRLPPERLGHPELELQAQAEHGHDSRSRPEQRTGGDPHARGHDATQHNVPSYYGASVDARQPDRHGHWRAFAVARIQFCAGGTQRRYAPHSKQSVWRLALRRRAQEP